MIIKSKGRRKGEKFLNIHVWVDLFLLKQIEIVYVFRNFFHSAVNYKVVD